VLKTLTLLVLCFPLSDPLHAQALGNPPVGKAAPAFSAKGIDGKLYSLSGLKGKIVVLEWTNPGCPFVRKHYDSGNMQSLQKKYGALGVVWLSVLSSAQGSEGSFENDAEAKAWLEKEKAAPASLIRDSEGTLGKLYGAKATPHMFVINAKGFLAYKGAIDDKASADPGDITSSKNWVSQALDALLAGKAVAVPETRAYGCRVKYKD
jgi:peroxiredoxin